MKLVWIHRGGPEMASYRLRALIPALECKKAGHEIQINQGEGEVIIFAKPTAADLEIAKQAKASGVKVVVDFCDDHFSHPTFGPVYREFAALADQAACASSVMAQRILEATGKDAAVIPDPYETPELAPHAEGEKLLWFGHASNLQDLAPWFPIIQGSELRIVTNDNQAVPYVRWSLETLHRELGAANIVLLPTRKGAEYKSPNRLITAIRGGCFPVCSNHPAYAEFKDFVWVGPLPTGWQWARHFKNDLNALVAEGQKYIEKFSPDNIGKQWQSLFVSI